MKIFPEGLLIFKSLPLSSLSMGRHILIDGYEAFYMAGWIGRKIVDCIDFKSMKNTREKIWSKMYELENEMNEKKIQLVKPPYPKASPLSIIPKRDGNWWFAVNDDGSEFNENQKLLVLYWTLEDFEALLRANPKGVLSLET